MIGQNKIKNQITNLSINNFPRVVSIIGRRGFGKTTVIKYILSYLNILDTINVNSIDDIREVIKTAPNLSHNVAIHIDNFEKLNFRAKETLLKLCEDTPNFIYIFIEVTNSNLFSNQFMNRSLVLTLEPYSKNEIDEIIHSFGDLSDTEIESLKSFLGSPKDFKLAIDYGNINDLKTFIDTVYKNVSNAEPYNSMKILNKLKIKKDSTGIDFNLFFDALYNISFRNFYQFYKDSDFKLFNSCYEVLNLLDSNPNINKKMLFDNFILSLKEI